MFTPARRDAVRRQLLDGARRDERIVAAAITGSAAQNGEDAWSDIDLAFGLADGADRDAVLADWTMSLERDWQAVHYWDLPFGPSLFRAFLLPDGLEVDISFTPASAFGPYTPSFSLVFGVPGKPPALPAPDTRRLIGIAWHHVLHARASIERERLWQAVHLISALRDHIFTLAGIRLGLPTTAGKGFDALPVELRTSLQRSLIASLDAGELRQALAASADALLDEVARHDPAVAASLTGPLRRALK